MTVFELMATLGLDTSEFDSKLTGAVEDVQELSDKAEDLTNPTLGGTTGSVLNPLIGDADAADQKLSSLKEKAAETNAVMEGVADAVSDVVKAAIEGIVEFAGQSIEAAASTGSELADAFNKSKDDFTLSLDAFKVKVGETMLPVVGWFYDLGDALAGMTHVEKMEYLAQQLQALSEINLERTREQVAGVFDLFETVEKVKPGDLSSYQQGLESQTEYWQDYAETLNSLKEKGVDPAFLGEIADGSAESLEALRTLDTADTEGLTNMLAAYDSMKAAQDAAAESMSSATLAIEENAQAISDAMAGLIVSNAEDWGYTETTAGLIAQKSIDALTEKYPAIESMVNAINAKLAELWGGGENPLGLPGVQGEEGTYKGQAGEGEKKSSYIARIDVQLEEGSEEGLQGEVDSMSLGGEVLMTADPSSGTKLQSYLNGLNLTATVNLIPDGGGLPGFATGLDYVPHDDFVARLHEGEAVLTKLEADRWRRGEGGDEKETIVVNQYITVAKNEDFGAEVRNALEMMRWQG